MLRRGLCLLLTAALCLTTGCVADRAAMQAEAEQASSKRPRKRTNG